MPSRERRERELKKRQLREQQEAHFSNLPSYAVALFKNPSPRSRALSEALSNIGPYASWGMTFSETGEPMLPRSGDPDVVRQNGKLGAAATKKRAQERAERLRQKYGKKWRLQNKDHIAELEGLSARTVVRHMKRAPIAS